MADLYYPSSQCYTVYGTGTCPFCVKAKALLQDKRIEYIYVDISNNKAAYGDTFRNKGIIPADHRTIPFVFDKGTFIGGFTELNKQLEKTELTALDEDF